MRYQRTQIYLEPEHHRRLVEEARARGVSLASLLREIVADHVSERAPRYASKGFDAIIGIAGGDEPTDIVGRWDEYMDEAMDALYEKKMSLLSSDPPRQRRKGGSRKR